MAVCKVSIHAAGSEKTVDIQSGTRLSKVLREAGVPMSLPCGGAGRCGKCRVRAEGELSPYDPEELALLTPEERSAGIRLACRTEVLGDAGVWTRQAENGDIQVDGLRREYQRDSGTGYGVAVDIGTTTVAAALVDLSAGEELASACAANPQGSFGADVISRIERALDGDGEALRLAIRNCIEELLQELCLKAEKAPDEIVAVHLTGNTTMLYLLTGRNVDCLSHAPFVAEERFGQPVEMGFCGAPKAVCILTRCASAFVGGDITAAVIASGMAERRETSLLLDAGTNGEIVLAHDGKLLGASTAAGPALEGAGIYMGMPAVPGAVRRVIFDGGFRLETVDGAPDHGICGSGVIDAMAVLLKTGIVDETGLLLEEGHPFTDRICEVGDSPAFRLGERTVFTQKDIRAVQLAKAAICAGIYTLLHEAGLKPEQVERFYIAGGFGSHIDVSSAAAIGLFPAELAPRAVVLGNAALTGAEMLLQSRELLEKSRALADSMESVELSTSPYFSDRYMESMFFEME